MTDVPIPETPDKDFFIDEYFEDAATPMDGVEEVHRIVLSHCENNENTLHNARVTNAGMRAFAHGVLVGANETVVRELVNNICEELDLNKTQWRDTCFEDHIEGLNRSSSDSEDAFIDVIDEECTQCTRVITRDATAEEEWHWTFEHDGEKFHFVTNGKSHKDPSALRDLYNRRVSLDDQHDGAYVETGNWNDAIESWTKENADENRVPGPATRALNYVKKYVAAATEYGELADAAELGGVWTTSYQHPETGESTEELWIPNDVTSRAASNADIHINKLVSEVMSRGIESDGLDEGVNHDEDIDGEGSGTEVVTFWRFDAQHFPSPAEYKATADTVNDLMGQGSLPGESPLPDGGKEPDADTDDGDDENTGGDEEGDSDE